MLRIRVQSEDFDPGAELAALQAEAGAVASFIGVVRDDPKRPLAALTLEHYPGMTETAIARIAEEACARFALTSCTVIHRIGRLVPRERIVLAAAASAHRRAALDATSFLIDWLKTAAPFWKHERFIDGGEGWVEAKEADDEAAAVWGRNA